MHIVRSVRGKRTLFFAGFKHDNPRKPRFTPKAEDAQYLELSTAQRIRDNLSDRKTGTKCAILSAPDRVDDKKIDAILESEQEWTLDDLQATLSS